MGLQKVEYVSIDKLIPHIFDRAKLGAMIHEYPRKKRYNTMDRPKQFIQVFVSSTYKDLEDHRKVVLETLHQLETTVRGMEYFGSKPGSTKEECLKAVRSCNVYIGIFGMRYGSIDEETGKSLTHLEYEEAKQLGLPRLIYLIDEKRQPILPIYIDTGENAEKLQALKTELKKETMLSRFTTPEDLAKRIALNLPRLLEDMGAEIQKDELVSVLKTEYFNMLRVQCEYLDLGGISPRVSSKVIKIRIADLFIPLEATQGFLHLQSTPMQSIMVDLLTDERSKQASLLEFFGETRERSIQDWLPRFSGDLYKSEIRKSQESRFMDFFYSYLRKPFKRPKQRTLQEYFDDFRMSQIISSEVDRDILDGFERLFKLYFDYTPILQTIELSKILEQPRVVVLGDPGSGKTTICKHVAYSIAVGNVDLIGKHLKQHIPVIVRTSEFAWALKENPSLSFYEFVIKKHTTRFSDLFEWALQNGRCIMIIDGLDEISETQLRITALRRIEQFVSEFQTNQFLVTSRIVGYRSNPLVGDFFHITLKEFDDDQIKEFLGNWYRAIERETEAPVSESDINLKVSELWGAINSNPSIHKLAGNPLLLTIIALTHLRGTKLPNKRVELYQIATETLIENWPLRQRGIEINSEEILTILEPIAYHIFSSGMNNLITEYELRPIIEALVCEVRGTTPTEAKPISRRILRVIEEHTGFFLERGYDPDGRRLYGFLHLTFAEYLTARFLANKWASGELKLEDYVHDARWHEVLLLMAGHIGTWAITLATQLVNNILELKSQYEDYLCRDLFLAAEILGNNVRVKRELHDKIVLYLISQALSTPHKFLWETIIDRLKDITNVFPLASSFIQQHLQLHESDPLETQVRKAVLLANAGKTTDKILYTLIRGLIELESSDITLFYSVSFVIKMLLDRNPPTHLLSIGKTPSIYISPFPISEQAAHRVARLQLSYCDVDQIFEKPVTDYNRLWLINLQEFLKCDVSTIVTFLLTTQEVTPFTDFISIFDFTHLISKEKSNNFRISLCRMVVEQATLRDASEYNFSALILLENLIKISFTPVEILSESLQAIQSLITLETDPKIRMMAVRVFHEINQELDDIGSENWINIIQLALDDPTEEVRYAAANLDYGSQIPASILNKLRKLLTDTSQIVREASSRTLIRLGEFEEEDIPTMLEEGFGHLKESSVINLDYVFMLSNKAQRSKTIKAIGTFFQSWFEYDPFQFFFIEKIQPRRELVDIVNKLLSSPNSTIRYNAVNVWARIQPDSTLLGQFLPLLNDPEPKIKCRVIESLRPIDLQQSKIIDVLINNLKEVDSDVASSAALALSKVRALELRQKVIDHLGSLLEKNPDNIHIYETLWKLLNLPYSDVTENMK